MKPELFRIFSCTPVAGLQAPILRLASSDRGGPASWAAPAYHHNHHSSYVT